MLKKKHALEEQEEKIRKRKEQLEADIATSMAEMAVLGASGSGVRTAASRRSDGMKSHIEKN